MARTSSRTNVNIKKQKPLKGPGWEGLKFVDEYLIPKTPADAAMYLIPYGKIAKGVYKGAKKVIKATTKTKKVTKTTKKK